MTNRTLGCAITDLGENRFPLLTSNIAELLSLNVLAHTLHEKKADFIWETSPYKVTVIPHIFKLRYEGARTVHR